MYGTFTWMQLAANSITVVAWSMTRYMNSVCNRANTERTKSNSIPTYLGYAWMGPTLALSNKNENSIRPSMQRPYMCVDHCVVVWTTFDLVCRPFSIERWGLLHKDSYSVCYNIAQTRTITNITHQCINRWHIIHQESYIRTKHVTCPSRQSWRALLILEVELRELV